MFDKSALGDAEIFRAWIEMDYDYIIDLFKVAVQQACGLKGICRNGFQDTKSSHKDTRQVDCNASHDIFASSLSFLLDA